MDGFSLIILIVFVGIILALVIVAIIGSRKDKVEKMIATDKSNKVINSANKSRIVIFISLDNVISNLGNELKEFKPSVGTKTLGQINKEARDVIKQINNSKELREVYKSEDYKIEIKPIMDELIKVKPSNWEKEASFSTNLVKVKAESIKAKKENSKNIKAGEEKKWN